MAKGTKIVKGKSNATQGSARVVGMHGKQGSTSMGRGGHQSVTTNGRVVKCGC